MKGHRLILIDRCASGEFHLHRWTPACSCGFWTGVHRRTAADAKKQWRNGHEGPLLRAARRRGKQRAGHRTAHGLHAPRPLTPEDQLPDELRGKP